MKWSKSHNISWFLLFGFYLGTTNSISNWLSVIKTGYNVSYSHPCNTTPPLTDNQYSLCQEDPQVLQLIAAGISMSLAECQLQFKKERWNCTTESYISMPITSTRESAFIYSLTSAAIVHSISRACSMGNLTTCSCAKHGMGRKKRENLQMDSTNDWKWGGCSDNVNFAVKFSQRFFDTPQEESGDSLIGADSMAMLHNKRIGRKVVVQMTETKCRCHGSSTTCLLRTCWRSLASFSKIGDKLKKMYDDSSVQVFKRKRNKLRPVNKAIEKRSLKSGSLVYISRSPDFCVQHPQLGIQGVTGRECNKTGFGVHSCTSLCCGRGYNTQLLEETVNCNCKFFWCCHVECDKCHTVKEVYTCK